MSADRTYVIVGGGLAGAKAAETLRKEGFGGRVVLLGDEAEEPYERPPLSKDYLRGETTKTPVVHPEGFYDANAIELRTGTRVVGIEPRLHGLLLEGDQRLGFDALLIATGAVPRRLSVPGHDLEGIHYLRSIGDAQRIGSKISAGGHVVVVGAGWIGCEVAASARQKGCEVTVIEAASLPLERVLGPEIGRVYLDLHRDNGVEFLPETTVARFEGERVVERVVTGDGAAIEADFVVVGIGVAARVGLAEAAGLRVDDGILADAALRASAEGIFVAGDVARAWHPLYRRPVRVEHWANALNQGQAAARSMLGEEVSYDDIPYFFSDQYDAGMEYSGYATQWDEVIFRGDPAAREFMSFWIQDDRVVAGMNFNKWDVHDEIRELIRSGSRIDRRRLIDPDVPLAAVVASRGPAAAVTPDPISAWMSEGGC